ncbi:MAG: hypothetical protein HQK83_12625 [Fibrobacteria bacterium]|nr:hypothetical protein [Fibrobacteria bacterium]
MKLMGILKISLLLTVLALAEDKEIDQVLIEIGDDAAAGYVSPLMNTFGCGMLSGLHNSSKPLSFYGLPMGISIASASVSFGQISEKMKTFHFKGDLYLRDIFESSVANSGLSENQKNDLIPRIVQYEKEDAISVFGSQTPDSVRLASLISDPDYYHRLFVAGPLDSNLNFALPFKGIVSGNWWVSLPNVTFFTFGFNEVPMIDNIQLSVSYLPDFTQNVGGMEMEFNIFNYRIQHAFSPYFPGLKNLPFLHTSFLWGHNFLNFKTGNVSFEMQSWTAMLNTSLDYKVSLFGAGMYMGAGLESSSLMIDVTSDYSNLGGYRIKSPSELSPRYQVGARVSLLMFDFWAEYSIGDISAYTVGATLLSFNGL